MLRRMILPAFALVAMLSPLAMAQETGGNNNNDRQRGGQNNAGGGGGGGGGDWRQRMADRLKEDLGATDDEMKVIQPKIEKLMLARRDTMGGFGFGGRGGPGGRGGRGGDSQQEETPSPAQQASSDLRQTLENKSATPEEIAAKLKALREARTKAREAVATAQKDLKEVLTQRQEAVLVNMGMLE